MTAPAPQVLSFDDALAERDREPTVTEIVTLMALDPIHGRDKAAIYDAIRHDARTHGGEVDPNRVRDTIPAWVYPRMVGVVYRLLKDAGILVFLRWDINADLKGRNTGKPQRVYRWVEL